MDKERPFSPETKKIPPIPSRLDLILIDGKFAQCKGGDIDMGVTIMFIEDKSSVRISPEEWTKYTYEAPPKNMHFGSDLVENGLMNEEQLQRVHWGPEQEEYPELRGQVRFFGTYNKGD